MLSSTDVRIKNQELPNTVRGRRTYLYVHRFLGSMVSIDWNYFIPLFAAMAVFLIGMFAYNAKKKDNE